MNFDQTIARPFFKLFLRSKRAYNYWFGRKGDIFRTICTYSVAFALTAVATEAVKNYVGYLRPVFFQECQPDDQYETCIGGEDDVDEAELRKSFVSGHASLAFCGGTLFTMFLERTIGLSSVEIAVAKRAPPPTTAQQQMSTDGARDTQQEELEPVDSYDLQSTDTTLYWSLAYRRNPGWRRLGSILALIPMAVATWVAASRVVDNLHFPADVVGGSVLGASIALYCHPLW